MKTSKNKKSRNSIDNESEALENIDKDLNDLISQNESLKKGISKIFKEIEKENNNN